MGVPVRAPIFGFWWSRDEEPEGAKKYSVSEK